MADGARFRLSRPVLLLRVHEREIGANGVWLPAFMSYQGETPAHQTSVNHIRTMIGAHLSAMLYEWAYITAWHYLKVGFQYDIIAYTRQYLATEDAPSYANMLFVQHGYKVSDLQRGSTDSVQFSFAF